MYLDQPHKSCRYHDIMVISLPLSIGKGLCRTAIHNIPNWVAIGVVGRGKSFGEWFFGSSRSNVFFNSSLRSVIANCADLIGLSRDLLWKKRRCRGAVKTTRSEIGTQTQTEVKWSGTQWAHYLCDVIFCALTGD